MKDAIRREWQGFWLCMSFLTRIPVPIQIDYSQRLMNQSSVYFPLVGLLLGGLYAVLFLVLEALFSPLIGVLGARIFHLWITGAFHEDGLADALDALGGGFTVEKRLTIMKDSRIGTYGTVALVMALGLKVALLLELEQIWVALLVTPVLARLTPLFLMSLMPYVTDIDASKTKPIADTFSMNRLAVATAVSVLVAGLFGVWLDDLMSAFVVGVALTALLWGAQLRRTLGGSTGDALGASVVSAELGILAVLAL